MQLGAILTSGWRDDPAGPLGAMTMSNLLKADADEFLRQLRNASNTPGQAPEIAGLDRLFRRRTNGFEAIKQFVAAMIQLPQPSDFPTPVPCRIDAFAYAFLSGAKNFDLLLPVDFPTNKGFLPVKQHWETAIEALETFERSGEPLPSGLGFSREDYLRTRRIVSRPSARDERNTLAVLLWNGPSTLAEVSQDLRLNYTLGQRTVGVFEPTGTVERRADGVFAINQAHIPLALFCLRETMGLDPLTALTAILETTAEDTNNG